MKKFSILGAWLIAKLFEKKKKCTFNICYRIMKHRGSVKYNRPAVLATADTVKPV